MGNLTPEGKIKRKVNALLDSNDIWHFSPANNGFGKSGIPDIIAIVNGQFVGIECKADPSKKPTALQRKRADEIHAAGGLWFLVRCEEDIVVLAASLKLLKC